MDWENKHFRQDIFVAAPVARVIEAAQRFATTSLPEWSVDFRPDGFDARGSSGAHRAVAKFHFAPEAGGTRIDVELLVERAGLTGFMLFDPFGYYDGVMRKWLWTIWRDVTTSPGVVAPAGTIEPNATVGARVAVMDAQGNAYLGVVRHITAQGVLVAYDGGTERWVPVTAAHVVPH